MLEEAQSSITEQSQWRKVKGQFDHDPRYKAVESSGKREEFFAEFQRSLKDKDQVCACVWRGVPAPTVKLPNKGRGCPLFGG